MDEFLTYADHIPYLTTEQMIEVDRLMIEKYRIDLLQMMENAGRNLAHLARIRLLESSPIGKHAVILAGAGNNGGGAMVCARRLHSWGVNVRVFVTRLGEEITGVPAHQLGILLHMGLPIQMGINPFANNEKVDLIIDGLIGYGLKGAPSGRVAEMIRWANAHPAPVLALDAPSGIDITFGSAYVPAIRANCTMTLALPKEGLRASGVQEYTGELYLADISVPPALYAEPSLNIDVPPIFARSDIVRLR